jgi:hypothetical protein
MPYFICNIEYEIWHIVFLNDLVNALAGPDKQLEAIRLR